MRTEESVPRRVTFARKVLEQFLRVIALGMVALVLASFVLGGWSWLFGPNDDEVGTVERPIVTVHAAKSPYKLLRVKEVLVRKGERVEAGQPLVVLHAGDLHAQRLEAEGQLLQAQAKLDQEQAQAKRQDTNMLRMYQESVDTVRARLEEIDAKHQGRTLRAPMAARVESLNVQPGTWFLPDTPVATLVEDDHQFHVRFSSLLEKPPEKLMQGSEVPVRVDAFPGRTFTGVVEKTSPAEFGSGWETHISLREDGQDTLLSGMTARVTWPK